MTGRERLQKVFKGEKPDKVPHFELVFQIPEQAFGESWPTEEEFATAPSQEQEINYRFYRQKTRRACPLYECRYF